MRKNIKMVQHGCIHRPRTRLIHTQDEDAGSRGSQCREGDQRQSGDQAAAPLFRQVKVINKQTGEEIQSGRVEEQSANPYLLHALVLPTELLQVLNFLQNKQNGAHYTI